MTQQPPQSHQHQNANAMNINNYVIEKYSTPIQASNIQPVTLSQMKEYMNITSEFQDTLITELIVQATRSIEKLTGLCLVPSTVVALIDNSGGDIELPLGPYVKEISIADKQGNNVNNYTLSGLQFKALSEPRQDYLVCTYKAGYTRTAFENFPLLPEELYGCIKDQVSFLFENRGENGSLGYSEKVYRTVRKYTRHPLFI